MPPQPGAYDPAVEPRHAPKGKTQQPKAVRQKAPSGADRRHGIQEDAGWFHIWGSCTTVTARGPVPPTSNKARVLKPKRSEVQRRRHMQNAMK